MKKTCNDGGYCQYKICGGTFPGCCYQGQCVFQRPQDVQSGCRCQDIRHGVKVVYPDGTQQDYGKTAGGTSGDSFINMPTNQSET